MLKSVQWCYNVLMTIANHLLSRNSVNSCSMSELLQDSPAKLGAESVFGGEHADLFKEWLALAMREDMSGKYGFDLTSSAIVSPHAKARARLICKQPQVVIAGMPILELIFRQYDAAASVTPLAHEGEFVQSTPHAVGIVECQARAMLQAERIALNILQRLSGIATLTRQFVDLACPKKIKILDTRKTTPGQRVIERYAVRLAGGINHRFGLGDGILIKDNHISIAGGVGQAIEAVRSQYPDEPIEIECASLEQIKESLSAGVHTIMLDNMPPELVQESVSLIDKRCLIEVSGGINLNNLHNYLLPGVDAISVGALTHSATNVDISLEVESVS